jgi:hypothetical protein
VATLGHRLETLNAPDRLPLRRAAAAPGKAGAPNLLSVLQVSDTHPIGGMDEHGRGEHQRRWVQL